MLEVGTKLKNKETNEIFEVVGTEYEKDYNDFCGSSEVLKYFWIKDTLGNEQKLSYRHFNEYEVVYPDTPPISKNNSKPIMFNLDIHNPLFVYCYLCGKKTAHHVHVNATNYHGNHMHMETLCGNCYDNLAIGVDEKKLELE